MFVFLLGLSWLVLTPVCVWLLFGRAHHGMLRTTAALTLAALQAATLVVGFGEEPLGPIAPASVLARHADADHGGYGKLFGPGRPAGPATGSGAADPGSSQPDEQAGRSDGASPRCAVRALAPQAVRLSRHATGLDDVTVYWAAATHECGTATVALHHSGRRLRIWLREGTVKAHRHGTRTLPVRVADGLASLDLHLNRPLRPRAHYVAVDARTGHRIPQRPHPSGA
ncbi:hypothetical protein [Planotetraspora sp. GP83]|uniref:hypothetical protein n=1 Tax=Planotetraspora sp. GP83 TaxID=3156264 RepID=UPI003514FBB3